MKKQLFTKGYSLIEVLVAISILLLAIAGPLTIASKGLQSSFFARDQVVAAMLAQEGIEIFTALRNEATLAAVATGDMSTTWNWEGNEQLVNSNSSLAAFRSCYSNSGCNVHINNVGSGDRVRGNVSVTSCADSSDCVTDYNASNARARFFVNDSTDSTDTIYTRIITLESVSTPNSSLSSEEVIVTSEVTWRPSLFGTDQSVTLTTSLLNQYGN